MSLDIPDNIDGPNESGTGSSLPEVAEEFILAATNAVQRTIWQGRPRTTVKDAEDEEDVAEAAAGPLPRAPIDDFDFNAEAPPPRETDEDLEYEVISVWDRLAESFLRAGIVSGALFRAHRCSMC